MKTTFILLLFATALTPGLAQNRLQYTIWADGLVNVQLPKSSFYGPGTGLRGEVNTPIGQVNNALFAQLGYGYFFQKPTSAFTASIGMANVGYRYQSRKSFRASVGVGAQYCANGCGCGSRMLPWMRRSIPFFLRLQLALVSG